MANLLKDIYTQDYICNLSLQLQEEYKEFNHHNFTSDVFSQDWENKELKQRMRHIAITIYKYLPFDYNIQLQILQLVSKHFIGMQAMYFQDFVEIYGVRYKYWDSSITALNHFTKYSSSEFAIRQFIIKDEKKAMQQMIKWAKSNNLHLRRLASEGCRPRLPWAISLSNFKQNPEKILEILEILKEDKEKYVQKSVANNINDISKDNPNIVIQLFKKWYGKNTDTNWILKHGCRTLLKNGNKEILELFGYKKPTNINITNFILNTNVTFNDGLEFSFTISSDKLFPKLRLEYQIDFVRQNNKISKKVFKISELTNFIGAKQINKRYSFKPISTRKYYKGKHQLYIIINGVICTKNSFNLI